MGAFVCYGNLQVRSRPPCRIIFTLLDASKVLGRGVSVDDLLSTTLSGNILVPTVSPSGSIITVAPWSVSVKVSMLVIGICLRGVPRYTGVDTSTRTVITLDTRSIGESSYSAVILGSAI